jgi:hypothetical protein
MAAILLAYATVMLGWQKNKHYSPLFLAGYDIQVRMIAAEVVVCMIPAQEA